MTRRNHEVESLILAADSPAEGARAAGVTPARAAQIWSAAGRIAKTGRPRSPVSREALAALGGRVVEIAKRRGVEPEALLDEIEGAAEAMCGEREAACP